MRTVDIIRNKRDGSELTRQEIRHLIDGYCRGEIPDYQMAAWAMAVFYRGMSRAETAELTMAMAESGDQADLSEVSGVKVDKHSTGGVGDKTSLIVAPLVAAAGVPVAKMSGRGLGHTGGTIDKLEAIPGFHTELPRETFIRQVNEIGLALIGQTGNITPADKKLYALRDVTATIESIPLIASSIMSKKLAAGADKILLDVKTGGGAFMKTYDDSVALAKAMVEIGTEVGRETVAVISDMDQPLGLAVGNALEVREAILTLKGKGPEDVTALCLAIASHMLVLGGKADSIAEAAELCRRLIDDGRALASFRRFVEAQGGDGAVVGDVGRLPQAKRVVPVPAPADGVVAAIDAEGIGVAAMKLGAGRETKDARIDLSVGILLERKRGDAVRKGEPLAYLHTAEERDSDKLRAILREVNEAYRIGAGPATPPPLIQAIVDKNGVHRTE